MRMIVFFDLPVETSANRRAYSEFRKFLINEGFIMMQKSVYTKLLLNNTATDLERAKVENNAPEEGLVQLMVVTEKQFNSVSYITGKKSTQAVDSDKRLVIL